MKIIGLEVKKFSVPAGRLIPKYILEIVYNCIAIGVCTIASTLAVSFIIADINLLYDEFVDSIWELIQVL